MDWQGLHKYFDQRFGFLGRITVSEFPTQQGVPIHPLVKLSTGLVLQAFSSVKNRRMVILLPDRRHFSQWIATFATLELMRADFYENTSGTIKFSKGEKLFINNCVVEFDREEFSADLNQLIMWVNCSKNARYGITLDRKLEFRPADTKRPLSSLEKVKAAIHLTKEKENKLDTILDIAAGDNPSFFHHNLILVSKIGETTHFIQDHFLNRNKLINLFHWGKIDVKGNITTLTSGQLSAQPCCLIASDLFSVAEYFKGKKTLETEGFIIDGTDVCLKDIQRLDDDILSRDVPIVVIADFSDTESLHHLEERGFRVWQWGQEYLSQSKSILTVSRDTPFASLNRSLANYTQYEIIDENCDHPQLESLVDQVLNLDLVEGLEEDQLQHFRIQLIKMVNDLSRLIWIPDPDWMETFSARVKRLQTEFRTQRLWLPTDVAQAIELILSNLKSLGEIPFTSGNHKVKRLGLLLDSFSPNENTAVALATAADATLASDYWQRNANSPQLSQIHFLAASDLRNVGDSISLSKVIICGWLNHKKVYSLLHSYMASKIYMLTYPFEAKWLRSAQKRWKMQNNYRISSNDFSEILKFPEIDSNLTDLTPQETEPTSIEDDFDIIEFELRIKRYSYSRFTATDSPREEIVKAKIVVFTQEKFAFITETHRLVIVTDLMRGKISQDELPRKRINQIQIGDYVLFRDSDKDIIREIADEALNRKGLSHLRETAGLWREALQVRYDQLGQDLGKLIRVLELAGCTRHPVTIRNWLFSDDIIGPRDEEDLRHIAVATGNISLTDRIDDVKEAITIVRSAHLQASGYITEKLLDNLPTILDSEQGPDTEIRKSMVLELDQFGQIMILRVEEIDEEWKHYEIKWVNRLLTQEDD